MSAPPLHIAPVDQLDAGHLAGLVARCGRLPLDYLPSAQPEAVQAMECAAVTAQFGRDDAHALAAWDGDGTLQGLAIVGPLEWETGLYGKPMARLRYFMVRDPHTADAVSEALLTAARELAEAQGYTYLDLQVRVDDLTPVNAAVRCGFRLVATHLTLVHDLSRPVPPCPPTPATIELGRPEDVDELEAMAARCVPPYSRYAVDPRLPRDKTPVVFGQWAANSVRGYAQLTLVARVDGVIAGYSAWRDNAAAAQYLGEKLAVSAVSSVVPEARRQNIFGAMLHACLQWHHERGYRYVEPVTHAINTGIQRASYSLGGRTLAARHSLHWHA